MTDIVRLNLLDPDAEDRAQQWTDLYVAVQRELFADAGSPWTLGELQRLHQAPEQRRTAWAAIVDSSVVGSVELIETLRDNLASATIALAVGAGHRGRGTGSALLQTAEGAARAAGRATLIGETEWPSGSADGSAGFASRHGYAVVQTNLRSHLNLPGDRHCLGVLRDGGGAASGGDSMAYAIEGVEGMPPRDWLDDLAELNRRMSTDAPVGGLALEEESWDAERVAAGVRRQLDSGRRRALSVARENATGRLVGFTEVSVSAGSPDLAYQGSTLVMREHRGHRLGLRLKAANALLVMAGLPDVKSIRTWNADDNAPMRAVNRQLGYVVDASHRMWQKQV